MPQLTDTRDVTREHLIALHERLARLDCSLASEDARMNARIAQVKSDALARTTTLRAERDHLEAELTAGVLAHKDWFEAPRAIRTPFGRFGLRTVSDRLQIDDEQAVIVWAKANATDVLQEIVTLDRDALKRLVKDGATPPGCTLPKGERAFYDVDKAILAAARQLADDPVAAGGSR